MEKETTTPFKLYSNGDMICSLSVQEAGTDGETSLLGGVGHTWDLECNPQGGKKVTHSLQPVCTLICNHSHTTAALVVS